MVFNHSIVKKTSCFWLILICCEYLNNFMHIYCRRHIMYDIIKQWLYVFHEIGKLMKKKKIDIICMARLSHKCTTTTNYIWQLSNSWSLIWVIFVKKWLFSSSTITYAYIFPKPLKKYLEKSRVNIVRCLVLMLYSYWRAVIFVWGVNSE